MKKILKISLTAVMLFSMFLSAGCFAGDSASKTEKGKFPAFSAKDLNGNAVTNEIFKGKKVTVINIWGTFCPPCIGEMPELGAWDKEMPKDAQIIGIVCDAKNEKDKKTADAAVKILESSNAKFINLLPSEEIMKYLETVDAVPTTIFVDSEGNILGSPVIGADVPKYKERLAGYLK